MVKGRTIPSGGFGGQLPGFAPTVSAAGWHSREILRFGPLVDFANGRNFGSAAAADRLRGVDWVG
jgi:hypothetical protein